MLDVFLYGDITFDSEHIDPELIKSRPVASKKLSLDAGLD
jgi:hypothetical protein